MGERRKDRDAYSLLLIVDGASPLADRGAQTCGKSTAFGVSAGLHLTLAHQPWATCESPNVSESQFLRPRNRGEIEVSTRFYKDMNSCKQSVLLVHEMPGMYQELPKVAVCPCSLRLEGTSGQGIKTTRVVC